MKGELNYISYIQSNYQLDTLQDVCETLQSRLKAYLQATAMTVGVQNNRVYANNKSTSLLDLELDSLLCKHLFQLKAACLASLKQVFLDFEKNVAQAVNKNFNSSQDSVGCPDILTLVNERRKPAAKPRLLEFAGFHQFIQDIPSI